MLYRLEHTVPFATVHNNMQIRLDITTLSYKRLPKEQLAQADAVTIEDLEIAEDEKFEAIRGRRISTRLIGRNGFGLSSLYSENPRKYRVETHKDGNLLARSYLLTSQSEEPFQAEPYVFDVTATVGLGDLKDFPYLDATGTAYQAIQSATEVLFNCLDLIGLELPVWIVCESYADGMDEGVCSLSQTIISPLRYYPNDEPMSAYEVLQDLCTLFGAYICQTSGTWKFVQVECLTKDTVKVWPFTTGRKAQSQMTLSIDKVIASSTNVEGKPFIHYDQRISNYDSLKLLQMEVEFGELINRLYNGRFTLNGESIDGWRFNNIACRPISSDPPTIFKDNYLEIDGKSQLYGGDKGSQWDFLIDSHVGVLGVFGNDANSNYQPIVTGLDDAVAVSSPFIGAYDQIVKITGKFLNIRCKGAKVQVIAYRIARPEVVTAIRQNPKYRVRRGDYTGTPVYLSSSGEWLLGYSAGDERPFPIYEYDNTKEERQGTELVRTAKNEWQTFEIETQKLPVSSVRSQDRTRQLVYYYAIYVVLFRGTAYEEQIPNEKNDPKIRWASLTAGVRDGLESRDIRKERHELEQDKPFGIKRDQVTIPLGSVGGENYYSQLLDLQGNPRINWYKRGGDGSKMALPALTLKDVLKVSGKPTKRVTGSVLHASFDLLDSVRLDGLKGRFMVAGASQKFPSEESQVVLAELYDRIPSHFRRYYTVDASGKAVLQSNVYNEGDIPNSEATLRITFLEPNGRSNPPAKLRVTGGVFPGGGIDLWSHDGYLAWFDSEEDGPYTVTVTGPPMQPGQLNYTFERTYTGIEGNYIKFEFPEELIFRVTVTSQSGAKATREIRATGDQKIQFAAPNSSCSGDTPVLIGVLNNNYPDIAIQPLGGGTPVIKKKAEYTLQIVNLITGEVVAGTDGLPMKYSPFQSWFETNLPEDWQTGVYGVRIFGNALTTIVKDDQCGYIMEVRRCKAKAPNFFSSRYGDRFYKQNN